MKIINDGKGKPRSFEGTLDLSFFVSGGEIDGVARVLGEDEAEVRKNMVHLLENLIDLCQSDLKDLTLEKSR